MLEKALKRVSLSALPPVVSAVARHGQIEAVTPVIDATKCRLGGVGGWAAAQARLMAPVERRPSRGGAGRLLNMKKTALVHVPPRLVHVRGGVGKFDFFLLPAFAWG